MRSPTFADARVSATLIAGTTLARLILLWRLVWTLVLFALAAFASQGMRQVVTS